MLTEKAGAYVLAAGQSARFGSCKVLEKMDGESLLQRVVRQIPEHLTITVVTGAYRQEVERHARNLGVLTLFNPDFEKGMGTSLRAAIHHADKILDLALITLADLPFVTKENYESLLLHKDKAPVFSEFGEEWGPPALFSKKDFGKITEGIGDSEGAKKLFVSPFKVNIPGAARDIDRATQIKE